MAVGSTVRDDWVVSGFRVTLLSRTARAGCYRSQMMMRGGGRLATEAEEEGQRKKALLGHGRPSLK
jgi:hypothetical protein